jgi:hypothetical protein
MDLSATASEWEVIQVQETLATRQDKIRFMLELKVLEFIGRKVSFAEFVE